MVEACIFDLDGVIVDTAKYHFLAWQKLAHQLGIAFTEVDNEKMKGISRKDSLEILLSLGDQTLSEDDKQELLVSKNSCYLELVENMNKSEILPGVVELIELLKSQGVLIALGSASKNARLILDKVELTNLFDAIVDGNDVERAKPDPEVFVKGAKLLSCNPSKTIVWEDSAKGIDAALAGGFLTVGIGQSKYLDHAHQVIENMVGVDMQFILDVK